MMAPLLFLLSLKHSLSTRADFNGERRMVAIERDVDRVLLLRGNFKGRIVQVQQN